VFDRRPIAFRWIFPLGQLALCWLMTALAYINPVSRSFCRETLRIVRMLNLPGDLLQVPINVLRGTKWDWHPSFIDGLFWAALTWPVLALIFWWFAGRAVDALLALRYQALAPRITLVESIVGGVLMLGGVVAVVEFAVRETAQIYTDPGTGLSIASGGLWALLGGLSVVARVRQSRLRRPLTKSVAGTP
jgi:hypothetical protein